MNIKELIEKAVENLNRVRQLNLNITNMSSQPDNDNVFLVSILDNESCCAFYVVIDENMSTQQLLPGDPTNISPDNIIMLRIAKHIFEVYKKSKNNISSILSGNTLASSQPISTLDIGGTTYDIGIDGKSLTDTIDEVDELKNRIRDLEDVNNKLIGEIDGLKTLLKAKGIL
ncbi:MAG: hypothetical protein SPK43_03565 [Candidatus Onthovivens sp.]|nr:hypothetical protein [Candidatus Onthovivens sp.]